MTATDTTAPAPEASAPEAPRGNSWLPTWHGTRLVANIELHRRRPSKKGWIFYGVTVGGVIALAVLIAAFAGTYSYSLQQTLNAMGRAVLDAVPEVVEVRLSLPNRHHFLVDLSPFGLDNPGEVFNPDDRPYGLIEGTVLRDDAPPAGLAWSLRGAA